MGSAPNSRVSASEEGTRSGISESASLEVVVVLEGLEGEPEDESLGPCGSLMATLAPAPMLSKNA